VVVDLATAEDLAQHFKTGALQPLLIGGTSGSGETDQAALLQQMQRAAG
jgi:hypothetical protein